MQLRKEEYRALERKNNETYTLIDRGPGVESLLVHLSVPTDALFIFPAYQERGTEPFKTSPALLETLAQLKYISIVYDMDMELPSLDGSKQSLLKSVVLKFKSKSEAKRARRRIIDEQHGESAVFGH